MDEKEKIEIILNELGSLKTRLAFEYNIMNAVFVGALEFFKNSIINEDEEDEQLWIQ